MNKEIVNKLRSPFSAIFTVRSKEERFSVIEIQDLKRQAADEIERLQNLIDDHNARCPAEWSIDD